MNGFAGRSTEGPTRSLLRRGGRCGCRGLIRQRRLEILGARGRKINREAKTLAVFVGNHVRMLDRKRALHRKNDARLAAAKAAIADLADETARLQRFLFEGETRVWEAQ